MNLRLLLSACLAFSAVAVSSAIAQDKAKATATQDASKTLEEVKKDQNDSDKLNKFFSKEFSNIAGLVQSGKIDEGEKALAKLETVTKGLSPDDARAKQLVSMAVRTIPVFKNRIEVSRADVDELKKKLAAKPADVDSAMLLVKKSVMDIGSVAGENPKEAKKQIAELKTYLTALADKVDDAKKKKKILGLTTSRELAGIERSIKSSLKLAELIGKPAMDLQIDAWANGSPLTADGMKGKVVLLDFWAVWCGPCIATFPHLREWQEKYGEKDFVMVGLTRYYNFKWDEKAGRAMRAQGEKVKSEDELAMLEKFADHHKIHHRLAVQAKDSKASEYYGVSGIPHVVVIDKTGVVRMVKVGSGEANATAIAKLLEELVEG